MAVQPMSEADLLASQGVVAAVNQMLANPKSRKLLLQARKEADPNAVIPEIDAAAPLQTSINEIKELMAADKAERAKEREEEALARRMADANREADRQRAALRAAGWREEGVAAIEKFAAENGIANLEIAASHWEKLNPPEAPAMPNGSGSWWGANTSNSEDDEFSKKMVETHAEDEGALQQQINAALQEVRSLPAQRR